MRIMRIPGKPVRGVCAIAVAVGLLGAGHAPAEAATLRGDSSWMTANDQYIVSGARYSIWISQSANITLPWVGRLDYYRGFYWSASAGRWYPASRQAQLVWDGKGAKYPLIENLKSGRKVVVGSRYYAEQPVKVGGVSSVS